MSHQFQFTATAVHVEQHDGYSTTSFSVFGAPRLRDTIEVDSPSDIAEALAAWAYNTPVLQGEDAASSKPSNAWSILIVKPKRWPTGFKQAGERSHTFVVTDAPVLTYEQVYNSPVFAAFTPETRRRIAETAQARADIPSPFTVVGGFVFDIGDHDRSEV